MKNSSKPPRAYFIAIGGTGMASLAGLLKEKGYDVSGSDLKLYPPMSDQLAELKIKVKEGWKRENVEESDLTIIGNAVSKDNPEVLEVKRRGLPFFSMPEAIQKIFLKERFPIVVAGTHGKTTTASLLAWILERCGQSPGFLIGGILKNFSRSYQLGSGNYFVVEGDEYDSAFFDKGPKFLHYSPKILILNAVEFDHADIYRDLNQVLSAFEKLLPLLPKEGLLVANWDAVNVRSLCKKTPCRLLRTGFHPEAELRAAHVKFGEGSSFDIVYQGKKRGEIQSPLIGRHNIQNLLSVLGVVLELGVGQIALPLTEIQEALNEFQGIKRRQELLGVVGGRRIIEDFAHHPTAIRETLAALREAYPTGRLWALFEPRSNTTRRNFFQKELPPAFDLADEILIAPLYQPEKIPPEERLDLARVVSDLQQRGKRGRAVSSYDDLVALVTEESKEGDIICLMSNGSFGGIYPKMITSLAQN